ncbi:MAG: hypothetical protein AB1898_15785 [Acidobacteriota bacterium]
MVGFWREAKRVLIAAQISALFGTALVTTGLMLVTDATVRSTSGIFVSIWPFAFAVINVVAVAIVLPVQMKIKLEMNLFAWCVVSGMAGSLVYLLINVVLAYGQGRILVSEFFRTGAYMFPVLIGALFGLIFGFSYRIAR